MIARTILLALAVAAYALVLSLDPERLGGAVIAFVSCVRPHDWGPADWAIFAALLAPVVLLAASLVPLLNRKTLP